jgi:hypothetical protein
MIRFEFAKEIGSPFCVSNEDGVKAYIKIADILARDEEVLLSFKGVTRLTTAFLNAAVGQLYDNFDASTIDRLLAVTDADNSHLAKLKTTMSNAKLFFKNRRQEEVIRGVQIRDGE